MYRPEDKKNPQYPVFARLNGRVISWLSLKCFVATVAAAVLAVALWAGLGSLTQHVSSPLTAEQSLAYRTELDQERSVLQLDTAKAALEPYLAADGSIKEGLSESQFAEGYDLQVRVGELESVTSLLSDEEIAALRSEAAKDGVTAETTDEELDAMVPDYADEEVPLVSGQVRFALAVCLVAFALFFSAEWLDGPSLAYLIRQRVAYNRQQHAFRYRKINDFGKEWIW